MAGETREHAAARDDDRLDRVIALLEHLVQRADQAAAVLEKYGPALDKAARLADSPGGRLAAKAAAIPRPWARD